MICIKKAVLRFICAAVVLSAGLSYVSCTKKLETSLLTIRKTDGSTVKINAEMARTESDRNTGYMNRRRIPDGTGMLFLFDRDQMLSFWMKNTPEPLSIAFIDSQGRIRNIFDMAPYSLATTDSTVNVRYALEVPLGWFTRTGIATGDTLVIDFNTAAE
jgi:uncharacterized protein